MEPWELWMLEALKAGVPLDLAELGAEFVRHNYQQAWGFETVEHFSARLIALALERPEAARAMWRSMIDSRGSSQQWEGLL
ncbi:MAG: hypothetical protein JWP36_530 [Paucimonas sp.]|nr:hypothetical protein [Paucimonas sp.]